MYLWIKAFHLIAMVAWFAGLFYIFRLFVYHVQNKDNLQFCQVYQVMERKLIKIIMNPAMILTFIFGGTMLYLNPILLKQGWMHTKFLFVVLLIFYHFFAERVRIRFAQGDFFLSEKTCRLWNEVPTVGLFVIIILAIVKPF